MENRDLQWAREVVSGADKFQPWDYTFILAMEKAGFEMMIARLERGGRVSDFEMEVRDLKLAVRLIDIIRGDDIDYSPNLIIYRLTTYVKKYVNTRNWERFLSSWPEAEEVNPEVLDRLRTQKAFYLYHKLRYYKMSEWLY